jgi:hypothetical protein
MYIRLTEREQNFGSDKLIPEGKINSIQTLALRLKTDQVVT